MFNPVSVCLIQFCVDVKGSDERRARRASDEGEEPVGTSRVDWPLERWVGHLYTA